MHLKKPTTTLVFSVIEFTKWKRLRCLQNTFLQLQLKY